MRLARVWGATSLVLAASACTLLSGVSDLTVDDGALPGRDRAAEDGAGGSADDGGFATDGTMISDGGAASSTNALFLAGTSAEGGLAVYPGIAPLSGGMPRAIGCTTAGAALAFEASPPVGGSSNQPNGPYRLGNLSTRAYGSTLVYVDEVSGAAALFAANEGTDCSSNPPKRIDRQPMNASLAPVFPRFAPNGARLAYLEQDSNRVARVLTTGVGGATPTSIRNANDVDAGNGGTLWFAPPAWIADDELVWIESSPAPTYLPLTIKRAKDAANAAVTTLSTCSRFIEQIEIFARGGQQFVAVVASTQSWSQNGAATTLGVHALADGCASAKLLATQTTAGSVSRDVAVSPDGAFIAFASNADTPANERTLTSPMNIFIVDSTGAMPPVRCSDVDLANTELAPQWLANGTKLVWMRAPTAPGSRESIWIADFANGTCSNARALLDDAAGGTRYLTQGNAGLACGVATIGARRGSATSAFCLGAIVAVMLVRRRRRGCSSLP